MKAVQVGILVALIAVAGLLFKVYQQGAQPKPEAAPAVATTSAPPPPAETATPPEVEKTAAEPAPVIRAGPAGARPSPAPRKKSYRPVQERPAQIAEAPANPMPVQAAPAPGPSAATQQPAAPAPQPQAPAAQELATRPAPASLNPPSGTQPAPREPHRVTIPAGTLLSVRLVESLSSDRNQAGDTFTATLDQPVVVDGFVIAERGARMEGRVLEAEKAGRVKGVSSLAIQLVRMNTSDGQKVDILTERFLKEGVTSKADDVKKVGVGAAIGAAIGAIAGGGKGAAIGAGVGGAAGTGTVMATRGKPAALPSETRISFKLQEPVSLTERLK